MCKIYVMKSLRTLLLLGPGPSSSHTIGPYRICKDFLSSINQEGITFYQVILYGSLALTGKGHFTDEIVKKAFSPLKVNVSFNTKVKKLTHPNTMELKAYRGKECIYSRRYLSIGGGSFCLEGEERRDEDVYPFSTFDEMREQLKKINHHDLYTMIEHFEGKDILGYGKEMLKHSFDTLENASTLSDVLPGPLKLKAVSKDIIAQAQKETDLTSRRLLYLTGYAYAVSEANARGQMVVTAPTCGAAGVVPAVLYYEYRHKHASLDKLAKAYLVGALVCNFIKENASVSGALLGCQAEIGSASCFASASLAYLHGLNIDQIEYAAEVSMEHFLGLTCDPVDGYVQIPCIERNGMASIHAYGAYLYAKDISLYRKNKVSFDNVVKAMNETGKELPPDLKETSLGGLAKIIHC